MVATTRDREEEATVATRDGEEAVAAAAVRVSKSRTPVGLEEGSRARQADQALETTIVRLGALAMVEVTRPRRGEGIVASSSERCPRVRVGGAEGAGAGCGWRGEVARCHRRWWRWGLWRGRGRWRSSGELPSL